MTKGSKKIAENFLVQNHSKSNPKISTSQNQQSTSQPRLIMLFRDFNVCKPFF